VKRIETKLPCILTGTHTAVVVGERDRHGKPLRTVINLESGLVYTDPRPSHDEVKQFYSEDYRKEYKGTIVPKKKHIYRAGLLALERWAKIESHIQNGCKILDAGAGGGEMLYLLGKKGCEPSGIEPNQGYANHAIEQYGVDIHVGFFEDAIFPPETFDVVLLFHVLEHLEKPIQEIELLKSYLKPGGTFIIEVPNVTFRQGLPTAKWHIGHLYNFNRTTLVATAVKAGLELVEIQEIGNGGNLFGVFANRKPGRSHSLAGNFERVFRALERHTVVRHLLTPHPYFRPARKAIRTLGEKWATRNFKTGKEILAALYEPSSAV
jgi:2-polyprenyl-3-methyl-5-hydroxy-6-metoxy-1,4-benzoquinol methylase